MQWKHRIMQLLQSMKGIFTKELGKKESHRRRTSYCIKKNWKGVSHAQNINIKSKEGDIKPLPK